MKKLTIKDYPIGTRVTSRWRPEDQIGLVEKHNKPNGRCGFILVRYETPDKHYGKTGIWCFTSDLKKVE